MKGSKSARLDLGADQGSALIIVLLFVVLLTGLTVAFLSRSMTARMVSNSSAGEAKATLLANSAGDIIIGDLKQEIVAGSSNAGTASWPVYLPLANQGMVPFQSGVPAVSTTLPNLVSRSVRSGNTAGTNPYVAYSAFYVNPPVNRAADDTTTPANVSSITPSLNGRSISLARWNSHYLLPRKDPTSATTDSTPATTFVAPDWVIVTRNGASSVTWKSSLSDGSATNSGYAIGRYAYAVYNEGGLLDMNVAGYPSGLSTTQISKKGSLALADLTQLPMSSTNSSSAITQAQIDNIVGWRNYASAKLTSANGSYNNFSFTSTTAASWMTNFVSGNTNGYLAITPPPSGVTTPPTDQAFLSRQQLISLTQSLGINPNVLQYLGTFSRGLEQPSFAPDPSRPRIINKASTVPPANSTSSAGPNANNYVGNNDGAGGDDTINPSFLSVRVATSFIRRNGASAVVGEPLVKTKFALSRLALIAYNATNATVISSSATAADPDPILDRFGLSRTSTSSPWVYNHGANKIYTLAQVAALATPREPDFAELLKAAIAAGSLAKGAPGLDNTNCNYQFALDTALDYQVLQIMANLIDQQDTDSYPTQIQIQSNTSTSYPIVFSGTEDLPYFYRFHLLSVVDRQPNPLLASSDTSVFPPVPGGITTTGSTSTGMNLTSGQAATSWTVTSTPYNATFDHSKAGTLNDGGDAALLYVVDLWNPHDPNTLASSSTNRPIKYRFMAATQDPVGQTAAFQIGVEMLPSGTGDSLPTTNSVTGVVTPGKSSVSKIMPEFTTSSGSTIYVFPTTQPTPLLATNAAPSGSTATAMTFSDSNGALFREPTLLWNNAPVPSTPAPLVGLSGNGAVKDVNTGKTYYGIIAGHGPVSMQATFTSAPTPQPTDGSYVFQSTSIQAKTVTPAGSYAMITYSLQYQDPNNAANWITYDWKYSDLHGLGSCGMVVNTADFSNGSWQSPLENYQFNYHTTTFDPRTSRWGVGMASSIGSSATNNNYLLEATANTLYTQKNSTGFPLFKNTNFSVLETQRPRADIGNLVNYSNPGMTSNPGQNYQMRLFSGIGFNASGGAADNNSPLEYNGLLSQNVSNLTNLLAKDNSTAAQLYFEDPDGMDRPAMAAYADKTLTDSSKSSLATASINRTGLPLATASTLSDTAVATPTAQSQSRPIVLNRPFRSVSEMSYCFRGTPWKNIDFFTPSSGDAALLDVFCINDPPSAGMVAGKVDLNTRQAPVLKAVLAGAYKDEIANASQTAPGTFTLAPAGSTLSPITSTEASNIATVLTSITSDTTDTWRGPLPNISALVGRFVASPGTPTAGTIGTDWYTYSPPVFPTAPVSPAMASSYTYAGLSAVLGTNVYTATPPTGVPVNAPNIIQRFRESAIRPLADAGQVRVWNLLIDVVAQTGRYPKSATGLNQFLVEGEKRVWLHVAIDRYTGQVIDKQVEVVTP